MLKLTFLAADIPLIKSFSMRAGELIKQPYPHIAKFSTIEIDSSNLEDFYHALIKHASIGNCLLKGNTSRPLVQESRAGSTDRTAETNWICFDLDRAPYTTPQAFMNAIGLPSTSYIVQYSASMGIVTDQLSCHIFALINHMVMPDLLKCWLMHLNLTVPELRSALSMTRTGAALSWPLDVTTCQNDKLLFIAPPNIGKGVPNTFNKPRIEIVKHALETIPAGIMKYPNLNELRKQAREVLNAKRKEAGLESLRSNITHEGNYELQPKPGEAVISGIKEEREFTYFNFNGGDSWGYFHPNDNFEIIYNFKGEPTYHTKELLPGYYADKKKARIAEASTPTEKGDIVLAFRDFQTAQYWNGLWSPRNQTLELAPAKSETQLAHYAEVHGKSIPDAIPIWNIIFNPQSETVVDIENKTVNTYTQSTYYIEFDGVPVPLPPITKRILESCVGTGTILEHFLNWVAVIIQFRVKTGTAWVLHGEPGTGKGLITTMLARLIGYKYVVHKRARELTEGYNGWIEQAIIGVIDEVKVSQSNSGEFVTEDLKNLITEPRISIRHMYRPPYVAENFTNLMMLSNDRHPTVIAPGDRRFNVGTRQTERLKISSKEVAAFEAESTQFFAYLMTRKASKDKAREVLDTEDRRLIIENSRSSLEMTCDALRRGKLDMFVDFLQQTESVNVNLMNEMIAGKYKELIENTIIQRETSTIFSRDELMCILQYCVGNIPDTPSKLTRLLGHHQIEIRPVRKADKSVVRGYTVNWVYDTEWLEEQRAQLIKRNPKLKAVGDK